MALSEVMINKFSQLVYLDLVPAVIGGGATVGRLADYYTNNPAGKLYLSRRFGDLPLEAEGWRQFLSTGVDDVRDFAIVDVLDDNQPNQSGFYGCAYRSRLGERVVAFRGSEMLGNRRYKNDYKTDMALSWAKQTPQQKLVDTYLAAHGQTPYYLTGHSLGGNLAAYGAVRAPRPAALLGCYAFNAPGFNGDFIEENQASIAAVAPKLILYQNQHDLISSMLGGIAEPTVIASAFNPYEQEETTVRDLFYPHSNFMFRKEGERFLRAEGGKDRLCNMVQKFTLGFLELPIFLRKAVGELLLTVIYSGQSPEKQVSFALEAMTKLYITSGIADSGAQGLAAGSAAFLAKQLWQTPRTYNALYRSVMEQGESHQLNAAKTGILLLSMLQFASTGSCCE